MNEKITEEVEAYLAMNGETGAWGESMRDGVGVAIICETLENGGMEITSEIEDRVRKELLTYK